MISALPEAFILRRAFRFGRVTRKDVQDAYPEFSYSKTGMVLSAVVGDWRAYLQRDGRSVIPTARAQVPAIAGEADLMAALEQGLFDMRYTGFRANELPARQVRWVCSTPQKEGVLTTLTRAIAHERGVEIRYVGLRVGESARWRKVYPLGLEQMGLQWRLVAQCLESEGYPVKVFVLPRILDAVMMAGRPPKGFFPQTDADREVRLSVVFDERLTRDQRRALAGELCLADGRVRLPERSRWEFERQYGHAEPHDHVVWPPVARLEE